MSNSRDGVMVIARVGASPGPDEAVAVEGKWKWKGLGSRREAWWHDGNPILTCAAVPRFCYREKLQCLKSAASPANDESVG